LGWLGCRSRQSAPAAFSEAGRVNMPEENKAENLSIEMAGATRSAKTALAHLSLLSLPRDSAHPWHTIPATFSYFRCPRRSTTDRRHPCKSSVKGKQRCPGALGRARTFRCRTGQLAGLPLGGGSCLRRTRHLFTVSGPVGPSQKIEFVFTASPETIRREPRECDLLRSVGHLQDLAVCAPLFARPPTQVI